MAIPGTFVSEIINWLAPISCRLLDWRMALGHIPRGFLLAPVGVGTAPRLDTKVSFQRKMSSRHLAIWDTPLSVAGRPHSAPSIPCALQLPRLIHKLGPHRIAIAHCD